MDNILDELDGNVTYQDLYKLHTGRVMNGYSDDSETSSESGLSTYDHLKPPPYTYEELRQNLVTSEGLLANQLKEECEYNSCPSDSNILCSSSSSLDNSSSACTLEDISMPNSNQPVTQFEKIAQKLSKLITIEYCFVCENNDNKHYKQESHYKNVINWLETQIKQPANIKLFFCQVCNLPLSGNKKANKHYEGKTHKEKTKSFCVPCLRVIEAIDMSSHCKSKKHLAKIERRQIDKNEKQKPNSNPSVKTVSQESTSTNFKSYASALKGTASDKDTSAHLKTTETKRSESSKPPTTSKHAKKTECQSTRVPYIPPINPFAIMLLEQIRRHYCFLCEEPVNKEKGCHYKKKKHYKALREWIEKNGIIFGYDMTNIDSVICFACHCVFPTHIIAESHYITEEHEKLSKHYCEVCMYHDNSDVHKEHKNKRSLKKESTNSSDVELKAINPELEKRFNQMVLKDYCHVCKKDNFDNHYLSKEHIINFRHWLNATMLELGMNMSKRLVFCEFCNVMLFETLDSSLSHYKSKHHFLNEATYCSVCVFRGTIDQVAIHQLSEEHHENLSALLFFSHTSPSGKECDKVNPSIKTDQKSGLNTTKEQLPCWRNVNDLPKEIGLPTTFVSVTTANGITMWQTGKNKQFSAEYAKVNGKDEVLEGKRPAKTMDTPKSHNTRACDINNMEHGSHVFITKKLKDMFSESFCQLCKIKNDKNHPLTKEHIRNIRKWLELMIQNTGDKLNRKLIFCEDCSMVLSGTEESLNHFKTKKHLKKQLSYCSVCIFRGSPNEVSLHHHSIEHHENLKSLLMDLPISQDCRSCIAVEKDDPRQPEISSEMEKDTLNVEPSKLNLLSRGIYESDSETPSFPDRKNINLLHLGLNLGQLLTAQIKTEHKAHAETCKNIFTEYWQLIPMLEILPLEVCLIFLRQFKKEVGVIYKQYVNILDDKKIERGVMTSNLDIITDTEILKNRNLYCSLNFEMAKLLAMFTKYLDQKFTLSTSKKIRRLTMLVRNFRQGLEEMKAEDNGLKRNTRFWLTNELPYLEEKVSNISYEVFKFNLVQETEQLTYFINNQKTLQPKVVLDYLLQFRKELLKDEIRYKTVRREEGEINEYFYKTECIADIKEKLLKDVQEYERYWQEQDRLNGYYLRKEFEVDNNLKMQRDMNNASYTKAGNDVGTNTCLPYSNELLREEKKYETVRLEENKLKEHFEKEIFEDVNDLKTQFSTNIPSLTKSKKSNIDTNTCSQFSEELLKPEDKYKTVCRGEDGLEEHFQTRECEGVNDLKTQSSTNNTSYTKAGSDEDINTTQFSNKLLNEEKYEMVRQEEDELDERCQNREFGTVNNLKTKFSTNTSSLAKNVKSNIDTDTCTQFGNDLLKAEKEREAVWQEDEFSKYSQKVEFEADNNLKTQVNVDNVSYAKADSDEENNTYSQVSKELLKKEMECTTVCQEVENLNEYYQKAEVKFEHNFKTRNESSTKAEINNEDNSCLQITYFGYGSESEEDSDVSFKSAVECLCKSCCINETEIKHNDKFFIEAVPVCDGNL